MIALHHLAFSRSLRVLWLLEALGLDYTLVRYDRTDDMRAPPELAKVHPLGKAPALVDGDLTLAESATILRYIHDRHGAGRFAPAAGTRAHALHEEWLDFVESSAAMPVMVALLETLRGGVGPTMTRFAGPQVDKMLVYIADGVGEKPFLMGDDVTLADIQMTYLLAMAETAGVLADHPRLTAYWQRLQDHPGFLCATAIGGPMMPPRQT